MFCMVVLLPVLGTRVALDIRGKHWVLCAYEACCSRASKLAVKVSWTWGGMDDRLPCVRRDTCRAACFSPPLMSIVDAKSSNIDTERMHVLLSKLSHCIHRPCSRVPSHYSRRVSFSSLLYQARSSDRSEKQTWWAWYSTRVARVWLGMLGGLWRMQSLACPPVCRGVEIAHNGMFCSC